MNKTKSGFNWRINTRLSVFTLVLLPVLVYLGVWQLSRATEKQSILESHRAQQSLPMEALALFSNSREFEFRRISAKGVFDSSKYWLIEGKVLRGIVGYEVLMPFKPKGSSDWLLVNRGWVRADPDRNVLPLLSMPAGSVFIQGTVLSIYDSPLIDERRNPINAWPHRILEVDTELMAEQFGAPLMPVVLLLSNENEYAFEIIHKPVNMPPEKHVAYAVQWFGLAVALIVLWLLSNSNLWSLISRETHIK